MSWNITFEVKDGGVDTESITVSGDPPDGPVTVNGHQGPDHYTNLGVSTSAMSLSATKWPPPTDSPTG